MRFSLDYFEFSFPQTEIPSWSDKVERWYQLDAFAFGAVQALERNSSISFDELFLASPAASTETDFHYVRSGTFSPQKFVHTLPNVRSSAALQFLGWEGPVFCIQNGPKTLETGIKELMLSVNSGGKPLLMSLFKLDSNFYAKEKSRYGALVLAADALGDWQHFDKDSLQQIDDEDRIRQLFSQRNKLEYSSGYFANGQSSS